MNHKIVYIAILISFLSGCNSESISPNKEIYLGLDYFPLEVGRFIEYNVDQTLYDLFGETTSQFQVKTVISDSFEVNGYTTYVINKFIRISENEQWQIDAVWSANILDNKLVLQQGNVNHAKLIFPIKEGKTWDGNTYNTIDEDMYEMRNVNLSYTIDTITFPETVTVIQHENLDLLVETDYRVEVFAKDVGLIYNEVQQIAYCSDFDCFGQQIINEGIVYKQTIIAYGNE
ncbi:MAG: hypothetical protein OEW67_09145 [Cyclobacteriaceae bacterium]|nr:hypothetical protein [Cyclobacteriaceae bacterium]